jgi:hypothetical protein
MIAVQLKGGARSGRLRHALKPFMGDELRGRYSWCGRPARRVPGEWDRPWDDVPKADQCLACRRRLDTHRAMLVGTQQEDET